MLKKKSYMDNENIIKEGFFDTLVRTIIPNSIQDKVDANAKKYYDKEKKKLDKKLQDIEKESDKLLKKATKDLEKTYGVKINDKEVKDYWEKQIYGK